MIQLDQIHLDRIRSRLQKVAQENPQSLSVEGLMLQSIALMFHRMENLGQPRDLLGDVAKFHHKFGLTYYGPPRFLPEDMFAHAIACFEEEIEEYKEAVAEGDLVKAHDALIDLVYFVLGRVILHGFPFREGWDLVQDANMRKVRAEPDGSNSKRGFGCDVVKPPGWVAPDHSPLFGIIVEPPKNEAQATDSGRPGLLGQDDAGEVSGS
jgi:hypothetical protein